MATQNPTVEEPEFISFLFSSKLKHDCFFLVGNTRNNQVKPEKIGVVKAMLMAHSVVLRLELEDSKLAEKGEVPVPDIYPDTFRTLLRYVYGQDTTAALCFDEADNLFYVAEKYMIGTLKNKLATRLMSLLNVENICSLLNNPAVSTHLELNSAITEILRYETDRVLASPLFLDLSSNGFVKILEQDGLNVPEIELWRAVVKWAKHNADTEDGHSLRKQVSGMTEHIKICTLKADQFCDEVVPTNILTNDEIARVCMSIGKREKADGLTDFDNDISPRALLGRAAEKPVFELQFTNHCLTSYTLSKFNFTIVTKKCDIELLSLECRAQDAPDMTPQGSTYEIICTTTITRITDYQNNTSNEAPVTVRFNESVDYGTTFMIPLISGGHNVTLLAKNKYIFRMEFDRLVKCFYTGNSNRYDNSHLLLAIQKRESYNQVFYYDVPAKSLKYKSAAS